MGASERALWVDVGGADKADWRWLIVKYKNGQVDFDAEPRWDRGSDEEPAMEAYGFSHTVGPDGVNLTVHDREGNEVTIKFPLDVFRNLQAAMARTASYLAMKRWKPQ